jgi:hypothetical protein
VVDGDDLKAEPIDLAENNSTGVIRSAYVIIRTRITGITATDQSDITSSTLFP